MTHTEVLSPDEIPYRDIGRGELVRQAAVADNKGLRGIRAPCASAIGETDLIALHVQTNVTSE
jgi:hypothetical protein